MQTQVLQNTAKEEGAADPAHAPYWPQLNGLRAVSMLLVFIAHVQPYPAAQSIFGTCFNKLSAASVFAVDQFFVLSAFLLTMLLLRERRDNGVISFKNYFIRRALRIWPLYFLAVLTACFLMPLSAALVASKFEFLPFLASFGLMLVQQFLPLASFSANFALPFTQNSLYVFGEKLGIPLVALVIPLWSISVEEQFYAICPFIAQKLQYSRKFLFLLIGFLACSMAIRQLLCSFAIQHNISHFLWFFNTFARLEPFLFGTLIAASLFFVPHTTELFRKWARAIFIGAVSLWAGLIIWQPLSIDREALIIPGVAAAAALTLVASLYHKPLISFLSLRPLVYLGQLSFSVYILHKPILWAVERLTKGHFSVLQAWPITVMIAALFTFLLANITYHLIEKRFLRLKEALVKARKPG